MSGDSKLAEQAVPEFHRMLDAEQFETIFDNSATELQSAATRKDFLDLLMAVHRKLGVTKSWAQQGWGVNLQHVRHIHHVDWPYPIRRRGRLRTIRLPFAGR